MPAEKSNRVQQHHHVVNRMVRSQQRTIVKKAEQAVLDGANPEAASAAVALAVSALDRAARKRVVHPNNAARHKSKLVLKLNSLKAQQPPAPTRSTRSARTTRRKTG